MSTVSYFQFGVSMFEFVVQKLAAKSMPAYWKLLEYIVLEMPTAKGLKMLLKYKSTLCELDLDRFDTTCLRCAESR